MITLEVGFKLVGLLGSGHTGQIFAIAVDDAADHLVSSGKDGLLLVRTGGGQEVQRMQMEHYACAMDVDAGQRSLFACGVAREGKLPPSILHFPMNQGQVGKRFHSYNSHKQRIALNDLMLSITKG